MWLNMVDILDCICYYEGAREKEVTMTQAEVFSDHQKAYWDHEGTYAKRFKKMADIGLIAEWQKSYGYDSDLKTILGWKINVEWKAEGRGKRRVWYETFTPIQFETWWKGFTVHERAKDAEKTLMCRSHD
jgi:hypothetical protein